MLALQEKAATLDPSLIVVSPMLRSTQTAVIGFRHLVQQQGSGGGAEKDDAAACAKKMPRWVAVESCRETIGVHMCDKRRNVDDIKADFPFIGRWLPIQMSPPPPPFL